MRPVRGAFGPRIRRAVQVGFLLLFLLLLLAVRPEPGWRPGAGAKLFFLFDPLLLFATFLAAHTVPIALLSALLVVALTLVTGRTFCGWVCPFGTVHDIAGRFFQRLGGRRKIASGWSGLQRLKYYLLAGFLVAALVGCHWVTVFDPLVLLYRSVTVALLPAFQWALEEGATTIYRVDPGIGPLRLTAASEPVYRFFRDHVFVIPSQAFLGVAPILIIFLVLVGLNAYKRRFWCRYLCPLGALLGLFSFRPFLRRRLEESSCTACDLCAYDCHGAAASAGARNWRASECFICLNCSASCPRGSLQFQWVPPWGREQVPVEGIGLSRRTVLASSLGGLVGLSFLRATPFARRKVFESQLIRPPGARIERDFLARCTGCGLCMKVCPTGGLQPCLTEAGLEGVFTPRLVPHIGYCDYDCVLCGHVCPTEAIRPLTVEEKHKVKIGLARFDTTRCLPYAYGRECIVCEEHCPVPDKAIYTVPVEIKNRDGTTKIIKQPRVDPDKCTGCGACENKCVYKDQPAIRVFSANESRNPDNQPVLPEGEGAY